MQPTEALKNIIQNASIAVDHEVLSENRPVSSVHGPNGEQQLETLAEFNRRIVITTIMYCVETGQLLVPPDADLEAMFDRGIPLQRDNRDGIPGIRLPDGSYTTR